MASESKPRPQFAVLRPSCPRCLEEFNKTSCTPKQLSCGHSICLRCLLRMTQPKLYVGIAKCPICKELLDLPEGGYAGLRDNLAIRDLLRTVTPSKCSNHAPEVYISLCMTCHKPLCVECQREALSGKGHNGHEVLSYDKGIQLLKETLENDVKDVQDLLSAKIVQPSEALQAGLRRDTSTKSEMIDKLVAEAVARVKAWGDDVKGKLKEQSDKEVETLGILSERLTKKVEQLTEECMDCIDKQEAITNKDKVQQIKDDHSDVLKELHKTKLPKVHTFHVSQDKEVEIKTPKFDKVIKFGH